MKFITLFAALLMVTASLATDIIEAKELHPELHTIQFTLAELPADFNPYPYEEFDGKDNKFILERIENSKAIFTNLATVHTSPNIEFSVKNGDIKGVFDLESNTIDILKMKLPEYDLSKPITMAINTHAWHTIFFNGKIVEGKEKKYCILIKCYGPKK